MAELMIMCDWDHELLARIVGVSRSTGLAYVGLNYRQTIETIDHFCRQHVQHAYEWMTVKTLHQIQGEILSLSNGIDMVLAFPGDMVLLSKYNVDLKALYRQIADAILMTEQCLNMESLIEDDGLQN